MDALEQYLRSESVRPQIGAERLHAMGQQAALRFTKDHVPLSESIPALAKEAGLNDEQTRRVIEFANNTTFAMMFKSGFTHNITFPLGDPAQILQKREAPVEKTKKASVDTSPERYVPGEDLIDLNEVFGATMRKTASVEERDMNSLLVQWRDKVADVRVLKTDLDSTASAFMLELAGLDVLVKQASGEGHAPYVIGACIAEGAPGTNLGRFLHERYGDLVDLPNGIQKVAEAGAAVIPNPISDTTQKLEELQQQLMATQEAVTQAQQLVDQMIQTMQTPINENPADELFRASAPAPQEPQPAPPQALQQNPQPPQEAAPAGAMQPGVA